MNQELEKAFCTIYDDGQQTPCRLIAVYTGDDPSAPRHGEPETLMSVHLPIGGTERATVSNATAYTPPGCKPLPFIVRAAASMTPEQVREGLREAIRALDFEEWPEEPPADTTDNPFRDGVPVRPRLSPEQLRNLAEDIRRA